MKNMYAIAFGIVLGFAILCVLFQPKSAKRIPSGKWWRLDFDITDDAENNKRSGLAAYIDHETGCHYLANSPFSGLTPRLDANGKQICEKQQSER